MNPKASEYTEDSAMSGYLYKKTRDNRWQKRWFDTNGVYLTYYKSRKMEKLLAALSLPQVGEIKLVPPEEDPEQQNGLFSLDLNTRIYILRAKSDQEAELWVNMLNKLRLDGLGHLLALHAQYTSKQLKQSDAPKSEAQNDLSPIAQEEEWINDPVMPPAAVSSTQEEDPEWINDPVMPPAAVSSTQEEDPDWINDPVMPPAAVSSTQEEDPEWINDPVMPPAAVSSTQEEDPDWINDPVMPPAALPSTQEEDLDWINDPVMPPAAGAEEEWINDPVLP